MLSSSTLPSGAASTAVAAAQTSASMRSVCPQSAIANAPHAENTANVALEKASEATNIAALPATLLLGLNGSLLPAPIRRPTTSAKPCGEGERMDGWELGESSAPSPPHMSEIAMSPTGESRQKAMVQKTITTT